MSSVPGSLVSPRGRESVFGCGHVPAKGWRDDWAETLARVPCFALFGDKLPARKVARNFSVSGESPRGFFQFDKLTTVAFLATKFMGATEGVSGSVELHQACSGFTCHQWLSTFGGASVFGLGISSTELVAIFVDGPLTGKPFVFFELFFDRSLCWEFLGNDP